MKIIFTLIFTLLMTISVYAESWVIYDMDFDVEAGTYEAAPEACIRRTSAGGIRTEANDCSIPIAALNPTGIYISWNTVDDVLGTNASTDWSINFRCIAMPGDSYPATGTDPAETGYWEADINIDGEGGGFNLAVPNAFECKTRVDADSAAVAAPTVK